MTSTSMPPKLIVAVESDWAWPPYLNLRDMFFVHRALFAGRLHDPFDIAWARRCIVNENASYNHYRRGTPQVIYYFDDDRTSFVERYEPRRVTELRRQHRFDDDETRSRRYEPPWENGGRECGATTRELLAKLGYV